MRTIKLLNRGRQHLRDCKGKMKRVIGWNLRISGVELYIRDIYLMFLSREIDKYCVKFIRKFIYIEFCIKVVVLNRSYLANTQPIWKRLYSVCIMWQRYCTAIGWSYGDVIQTIQTICNNSINYIFWKCWIKIKWL